MKEIPKPVITPDEPLDSVVARLARYGEALTKQQRRMIDKLPDSRKPEDGPKWLTNTSHDKALATQRTIHDRIAAAPGKMRELERLFGRRVR